MGTQKLQGKGAVYLDGLIEVEHRMRHGRAELVVKRGPAGSDAAARDSLQRAFAVIELELFGAPSFEPS